MENIIKSLEGKKVEVNCGHGVAFKGEARMEEGVVHLTDESGRVYFVDPSKIVFVAEVSDHASRPGFLG